MNTKAQYACPNCGPLTEEDENIILTAIAGIAQQREASCKFNDICIHTYMVAELASIIILNAADAEDRPHNSFIALMNEAFRWAQVHLDRHPPEEESLKNLSLHNPFRPN